MPVRINKILYDLDIKNIYINVKNNFVFKNKNNIYSYSYY